MSQAQEIRSLSEKQMNILLKNWFNILGVTKSEIVTSGKPKFNSEYESKYNIPHITKYANNYILYKCKTNDNILYFIIFEANKFDKYNFNACIWFYHLFEEELNKDDKYKNELRPRVFICPNHVITSSMINHLPDDILPCTYRVISLCDIYPLIGSSTSLYGLAYDYKIANVDKKAYNNRNYPSLSDSDPVVKVLNAIPGDIIQYKRILFDASPFNEYYFREVKSVTYNYDDNVHNCIFYSVASSFGDNSVEQK